MNSWVREQEEKLSDNYDPFGCNSVGMSHRGSLMSQYGRDIADGLADERSPFNDPDDTLIYEED